MMKRFKISWSRKTRKDVYLPDRCNANKVECQYLDKDGCDCKIWCKYPPPGTPAALTLLIPVLVDDTPP